jgi:hypothetical protein
MVWFDVNQAKEATLDYCRNPIPKTPSDITKQLQKKVAGFYKKSNPMKVVLFTRKYVLNPLVADGFLVRYTSLEGDAWYKSRGLLVDFSKKRKLPVPRKINELYQINFLYLVEGSPQLPLPKRLPKPDAELNLDLVVLLQRFDKPPNYLWAMLNFFLSCSKKEDKERLRLYVYSLGLDEEMLDVFEKLFDYTDEYKIYRFPFKPDIEESEEFIGKLTGQL